MRKDTTANPMPYKIAAFLLMYRTTPHATTGRTPSELLMGRTLRTRLDFVHPQLERDVVHRQQQQKSQHDQHAKARLPFHDGQPVLARDYRAHATAKWQPGIITEVKGPLTYDVRLPTEGLSWKRYTDQLLARSDGPQAPDTVVSAAPAPETTSDLVSTPLAQPPAPQSMDQTATSEPLHRSLRLLSRRHHSSAAPHECARYLNI